MINGLFLLWITKRMGEISILYLTLYGARVGGGEVQYEYLIKGLDRKRFCPIVICPSKGDLVESFLSEGIPTHVLKLPRWLHVQSVLTKRIAVKKIVRFAKKAGIDLIHSDHRMNPYMLAVSRALSIPNIVHVRSQMRENHAKCYSLKQASSVVSIGYRYRDALIQDGVPEEKIEVIFDAVDTRKFRPKKSRTNILVQEYAPRAKVLVGFVGRIELAKRQFDFLKIVKDILASGREAHFFVIGDIYSKQYYYKLKAFCNQNGLNSYVTFTGRLGDMPSVLASLDFLLTLSGGSVMIEAMSCGIPVIFLTSTDPSKLHIVQHNETGIVVSDKSLSSVTEAVIDLIDNPNLRDAFGIAGRQRVEAHFDVTQMVQKIEGIYQKLGNR